MIGFLEGKILFSDGNETIISTASGIGYQVYTNKIYPEGGTVGLYITHIIRENLENLFGFSTLQEKKAFELMLSVKGVGPKSAYSLVSSIGIEGILKAITYEDKKTLQKAPGIGAKAAAQIILDLSTKVSQLQMYLPGYKTIAKNETFDEEVIPVGAQLEFAAESSLIEDALLACKELGFKEEMILPLAQKLMESNEISRPEQLVHLVLKEV